MIDDQHRKLIDAINELHEAMRTGKTAATLASILASVIDYTDYHFRCEEKLMLDARYPDSDAHLAQHRALRDSVDRLRERQSQGRIASTAIDMSEFLGNWLSHHIDGTDKLLAEHLKKVGVT